MKKYSVAIGAGILLLQLAAIPSIAEAYTVKQVTVTNAAEPYCREYTKNVSIGNRIQSAYGTACLQPDGSWEAQGEPVASAQPVVVQEAVNTVNYEYVTQDRYIPIPVVFPWKQRVEVVSAPRYYDGHDHHYYHKKHHGKHHHKHYDRHHGHRD